MRVTPALGDLIAAFSLPGCAAEGIVRAAIEGRQELAVSVPLLAAFGRTLHDRFGWDRASAAEVVAQLARVGVIER